MCVGTMGIFLVPDLHQEWMNEPAFNLLEQVAKVEESSVVLRVELQGPSVVVLRLHHVFGQRPQVVESTCVTRVQPGKMKCQVTSAH